MIHLMIRSIAFLLLQDLVDFFQSSPASQPKSMLCTIKMSPWASIAHYCRQLRPLYIFP